MPPKIMSKEAPVRGLVYDPEKPHIDRVASRQLTFDEFAFQANFLDTCILLLQSPEYNLVLRAIHHLDRFARQQQETNYAHLHRRRIIAALRPLVENDHPYIKRFAMKLLSQMVLVPAASNELIAADWCFDVALRMYTIEEDSFLIEYSAIILNRMAANNERINAMLLQHKLLLPSLFSRIVLTPDPDVLLHSLRLIDLMAKTPQGLQLLCEHNKFPLERTMKAVFSEYVPIQMSALDVLSAVTACTKPVFVTHFESSSFMETIFEILENTEVEHLYAKTIALLREVLKRPIVAELFYKDASLERFVKFVHRSVDHRLAAMGVLTELAKYPDAQQALHDVGLSEFLMEFMAKSVVQNIATGITRMASYQPALDVFVRKNAVKPLLAVLGKPISIRPETPSKKAKKVGDATTNTPAMQLNDKRDVAACLAELFRRSDEARQRGMQSNVVGIISGALKMDFSQVMPIELRLPLIMMLNSLSTKTALQEDVMTFGVAEGLYHTFEESQGCSMFLVDLLRCMINYITQGTLRDYLMQSNITQLFMDKLKAAEEPIILKQAVIDFIRSLGDYPDFTDMLIDKEVLDCLLSDSDGYVNCPNWPEAIETILANNLSVKFSLRGFLELNDRTDDEFYATRKVWTTYRRLRQIFCSECSPRRAIFLCNYTLPVEKSETDTVTMQTSTSSSEPPYCRRPIDEQLPVYLQILRDALEIEQLTGREPTFDERRRCVELIADLVCTKICSRPHVPPQIDPDSLAAVASLASLTSATTFGSCQDDLDDVIERHLEQLKLEQYDCNIIPLGAVRVGGHFEKSLLFKTLADRVGLACALRMDKIDNRVVWTEVCMPNDGGDACADDEPTTPSDATHMIDLMNHPGNMYALGSPRALHYQLHVSTQ